MVSKKWQRRHFLIDHLVLFGIWAGTLFWFEMPGPSELEIFLVILSSAVILQIGSYLHNKKATQYVKVFPKDIQEAFFVTQNMFRTQRIPFRKAPIKDGFQFEIHNKGVSLVIESFPMNLQLDLDKKTTDSTKMTLISSTQAAFKFATDFRSTIDDAFSP